MCKRSYWCEELAEGSSTPRPLFHWPTVFMEMLVKIHVLGSHPRATESGFLRTEPRKAHYWDSTVGDSAASLAENHCFKSLPSGVSFPGWITYQAFNSPRYLSRHELVQQISLILLAGFQKREIEDEYNLMKKETGIGAGTNWAWGWGTEEARGITVGPRPVKNDLKDLLTSLVFQLSHILILILTSLRSHNSS